MGHVCYVCSGAPGDRIVARQNELPEALFPARFSGPPGTVNGGIAIGSLTCPALATAAHDGMRVSRISARFAGPVPVESPLAFSATPNLDVPGTVDVGLMSGESPVLKGSATLVAGESLESDRAGSIGTLKDMADVKVPERAPFFEETGDHPIRGCFSCGPDNARGMHIYPRVVSEGVTCAPWHADAEFDDGNGTISPMIIASALDCSSGICMPVQMQRDLLDEDRFFVLGSLDVHYLRSAPVERDYRITAKTIRRDGRKFFGISAMFDGVGTAYAMAEATWIIAGMTRTEAFGPRENA